MKIQKTIIRALQLSLKNNMKYDFNQLSKRRHTNSIKWDVKDNELPMWVADMDFLVLPEIKEAIIAAANKDAYGYTYPTPKFFEAYQSWWLRRHHIKIDTNDMIFVAGIVSALDSMVNCLTNDGDAILLLSPSYNGFFSAVNNNARKLITSNLVFNGEKFVIDYVDVEKKIVDNKVKFTIFCNPHNPTGRVWSKEEITKFFNICKKHNVIMVSDEIHCDIVNPPYEYTPALKISDEIIICMAPSKVFNLAGLHSAITVIKNPAIKEKVEAAFYRDDVGEPNYFVEPATVAAFTYGDEYVKELNEYLANNKKYVKEFFKKELPHLILTSGPATYLLWIDISYYKMKCLDFVKALREETGLFVNDGLHYGPNGTYFIRMNIATSLDNVKDGLNRLKNFLKDKE